MSPPALAARPAPPPELQLAGQAVGALPAPVAVLIYLAVTGSSTHHIAQRLGIDEAAVSTLRMDVARAFAPHMPKRNAPKKGTR